MRLLFLALFSCCAALRLSPSMHCARRASTPLMGLFDGFKDAFGSGAEPAVGSDRVTPFDRWLGLDKDLEAEAYAAANTVQYKDPNDVANYLTVSLAKPMGIAFVENPSADKGLVVDEVLPTGSAASSATPILPGDQLVAVDSTLVLGEDFDTGLDVRARRQRPAPGLCLEAQLGTPRARIQAHGAGLSGLTRTVPAAQAIKSSEGDMTRLVFFRGPPACAPVKCVRERQRSSALPVGPACGGMLACTMHSLVPPLRPVLRCSCMGRPSPTPSGTRVICCERRILRARAHAAPLSNCKISR